MTEPAANHLSGQGANLKVALDLPAVLALGLGTAVGVALFSVISPAVALAGPGMLLAVVIAALPMFVVAVNYAFMGSALPATGASYEWPRKFIHPTVAFAVAWLRILSSVGALVVLALVLVRYLSMVATLPTKPTMLALFALVLIANLFGVGIAARVQKLLMAALVVLLLIMSLLGLSAMDAANFTPFFSAGVSGILACVPLLLSLFFGIEAATEVGEEVRNSRKVIPLGIALSIVCAVLLYLMVSSVALGVLGSERLAQSEAPLLDVAKVFMGPWATPLIVSAALVAIGKSLNAIFLVFSRNLYVLGRDGVLPLALGKIHPRWGTPHIACWTVFALAALGLLLPMSLTFLFLSVSIPTLLKYLSTCVCAGQIARNHPDVHAMARFKPGRRAVIVWSHGGVVCVIAILAAGLTTDWRPYALLMAWALIGAVFYLARRSHSSERVVRVREESHGSL